MDHIPTISPRRERMLSLDQFRKVIQGYLERIDQTQQSLQEACIPFNGRGDIRPIHCKIALESLDEMDRCIGELGGLFYKTSDLPLVITALRFRLLFILHRIEKQVTQLEELIDGYRMICMTSSQREQRQRKNIYDSFKTLSQYLTDISQQARFLNEEAQFQEGRLNSIIEEASKS
jgi:hypothetical protein